MFSLAGAGLALTVPPADADGAAPMVCAVGYPAPPSLSSSVDVDPTMTGPPTAEAAAASVGCAFECPVTPARSSVPVSTSASCRPVAPRCAAPSPPLGGHFLVGRAVGGFLIVYWIVMKNKSSELTRLD